MLWIFITTFLWWFLWYVSSSIVDIQLFFILFYIYFKCLYLLTTVNKRFMTYSDMWTVGKLVLNWWFTFLCNSIFLIFPVFWKNIRTTFPRLKQLLSFISQWSHLAEVFPCRNVCYFLIIFLRFITKDLGDFFWSIQLEWNPDWIQEKVII